MNAVDLQALRKEIDEIDREIVNLYLKRMKTADIIGAWKRENGVPVYDPERERLLLDKAAELAGAEHGEGIRALFTLLLAQSRERQQRNR